MAEIPPFLWADAGTFPSPKKYKVPGAGEVQPYTATATYANASGQAILPALRLKSSSGNLLGLVFPATTIADGDSQEVSFVPPFGAAAVSAVTPSTTALAYGAVSRDTSQNIAANTQSYVTWTAFFTSDQAIFGTGTSGAPTVVNNTTGDASLVFLASGLYLVRTAVIYGTLNGAFGYFRAAWIETSADFLGSLQGPNMANYDANGISIPPGGGGGSNSVKQLDVMPINVPAGNEPGFSLLKTWNGDAALIHNVRFASMEAMYLGAIVPTGGGQVY